MSNISSFVSMRGEMKNSIVGRKYNHYILRLHAVSEMGKGGSSPDGDLGGKRLLSGSEGKRGRFGSPFIVGKMN